MAGTSWMFDLDPVRRYLDGALLTPTVGDCECTGSGGGSSQATFASALAFLCLTDR